jgi:ubiquinone/menaquinone biosynthesis C-methylase UbiE
LPNHSNVKLHFWRSADHCTEDSASMLWRWQRKREQTAIRALLGDVEGLDILDLGCGVGFYTRYCLDLNANEVTAVDFVPCPSQCVKIHRPRQRSRSPHTLTAKYSKFSILPYITDPAYTRATIAIGIPEANARKRLRKLRIMSSVISCHWGCITWLKKVRK